MKVTNFDHKAQMQIPVVNIWKQLVACNYAKQKQDIRLTWTGHVIHSEMVQPSISFHIETSQLFCRAKQMTSFYMKRNTRLKWVKIST